ncbi:unnamed protein product [Linum tenue]|uniref:Uncharacterized protein n=1 Tax=Linum tenue TaxID=586396 RepID=A0AAV0KLM0_9ROSI|nr:unnamed protein product [Linum tenue]
MCMKMNPRYLTHCCGLTMFCSSLMWGVILWRLAIPWLTLCLLTWRHISTADHFPPQLYDHLG